MAATSWRLLVLVVILAAAATHGFDLCSSGSNYDEVPGNITSPGFPMVYEADLLCNITIMAPDDTRLRLRFYAFDLRDGDDQLMIVDQDGAMTTMTGSSLPKDFIGTMFEITFMSDGVENNGTGFRIAYEEYAREAISLKHFMDTIDLKPGKALHLYTNDYPMLYDDDSHYQWTIRSPTTNQMVITVVDMDTEDQRDWLEVTSYSSSASELLLHASGTPTEDVGQITVMDADYVTIEFASDYSRSGRGFHIIVEPDSAMSEMVEAGPVTGCGGNFALGSEDLMFDIPQDTSNLYCVWYISNNNSDTRVNVYLNSLSVDEGTDYVQISNGLDPSDWKSYRRRLTGAVASERIFLDGGTVTIIFASGDANMARTFNLQVGPVGDYGCSGELDLSKNGRGDLFIGNLSPDLTNVYCQWLIKTPFQTSIDFHFNSIMAEHNYDILEIGSGSNPVDIGSRQKLIVGNVANQTFSSYSGDMWLVFSAEDLMADDAISISLSMDDNACRIKTILDLSGELDSPQGMGGLYPNDADCQWIIQVRGGFQVRLHFLEFDLEYGHDQLLIGGTDPDEDDVDSEYLVLTGSELPGDVVSRFNGLNLRFKTDSSVTKSGFKLTFQEFFDCPEGYEYDPANETCYKFVTTPADWFDARYDCDNVADGDLVVINDEEENSYVLQKIMSMQEGNDTENWWIGFYDLAINGVWSWVDCDEPTFFGNSKWQPGAPNNADDAHCAYIVGEDGLLNNGLYNEDVCNQTKKYVCEVTRKNYVDSDCYPSGFLVQDVSKSHIDLAFTVSNYLCDVSGYKIRYNTSLSGDYMEVELPGATNAAVVINGLDSGTTYHFELTTCTVTYGCYGYSTALSVIGTTEECPASYPYQFMDSCYSIVQSSNDWASARGECLFGSVEDSDLVNIETAEENEYLQSMIESGQYWIGLYDVVEEGEFFWSYECLLPEYRSWNNSNHPKNSGKDCVTMGSSGLWSDALCDSTTVTGYICEQKDRAFNSDPADLAPALFRGTGFNETAVELTWIPADQTCDLSGYTISVFKPQFVFSVEVEGGDTASATVGGLNRGSTYTFQLLPKSFSFDDIAPAVTSVKTQGCPLGFEASPEGTCYRYYTPGLNWEGARSQCQSNQGADLVSVNDETELNYIQQIALTGAWIGFSDSMSEGNFTWLDCSETSGESWSVPQENNEYRDCVYLDGGSLITTNCSEQLPYICEVARDFDPYPTDFSVEVLSFSEVEVSWTVSGDLCGVTGYRIQYYTNIIRSEVQADGAEANSVMIINLEEDTRYFFTISPIIGDAFYRQSDSINATTPLGPPCPDGYVVGPVEDTCYRFGNNFETWVEAREDCRKTEDSDLVEATDDVLTAFLVSQTGNGLYWMGLYDVADEGDWRWGSACLLPSYTNWAPGYPNNGTGLDQDCAVFNGINGQWRDQACTTDLLYVCEIKARVSNPESISPSGLSAQSQTPSSITVSWTPSQLTCDILAYIVSWTSIDGESGQQTVSGGDSSITVITGLVPGTRHVIFIDTLTHSFGNLGNSAGLEVTTSEECPVDYVLGTTGDCYQFVRSPLEFRYAREICQRTAGSDLVVIQTPQELAYVTNITMEGDWWVGLYDVGTEGNHRWTDCSDMNAWQRSNWAEGQPDDTDGTQDCGQMISSGEWMDWPCDRPNMYICEISPLGLLPRDANPTDFSATPLSIVSIGLTWTPSDFNCDITGYRIFISQGLASTTVEVEGGDRSSYIVDDLRIGTQYGFRIAALTIEGPLPYSDLITASTNNETVGCPEDYEEGYNGGCYRFVKGALTWEKARLECGKDFGGELVVVNTPLEYEYIRNRTVEGDWWIGLQDITSEGNFRWTDCSSLTAWQEDQFAPGQPSEDGDGEDCVQMISSGQWMDWPCQRPNQFICQIFAKDYVPLQTVPTNFSGEATSDSTVLLTWETSEYNCDIYAYQVEYTDLQEVIEVTVPGGDSESTIIRDLRANTPHRFAIRPLLIVERKFDYGIPIEVTTLPYAGCDEDRLITAAPGNISSPGFPGSYPPSVDCLYTISLESRIQLTFQLLFILPDEDDYVSISELGEGGEYVESIRLSGIMLPKVYISEGSSIQVRFVSDNRVEGFGFFLTFSEYFVEAPGEKPCSNLYTIKSGPVPLFFESPGYPNGYENFQDCSYVFQQSSSALTKRDVHAMAENLIELGFTDLDLESNYDFLVVGTGRDPSNRTSEIGRYSGNQSPGTLAVSEEAVWLRLETDSSNGGTAKGFSVGASEKGLDDIPATKPPPPPINPPWQGTCGGTFDVPDTGILLVQSPNYPDVYPNNTDCVWYFQTLQRRFRVRLPDSSAFQTETGYDIVEIGRGSDETDASSLYLSISGSPEPFSVMIEESVGWIRFTSDYSITERGFSFYVEQDQACEETIVVSPVSRTIRSPGYPLPYDNNEYCLWSIVSASGQPIRAVVNSFTTEDQYDVMDVGFGRGENAVDMTSRITQFSGRVNESFTANSLLMWLSFSSDDSNMYGGFEISFFDDMCSSEILTDLSGVIQSPGYGIFGYPNFASCRWAIQVDPSYLIRLTFEGFDLEKGRDTLTIAGSRTAPLGSLVLTGSDLPEDVISAGSNLIIQFSADSSVVGRGFSFTYERFFDCPEGYFEADVNGPTCYKFGEGSTWLEARADCRTTPGADLIVIENALENKFIRENSGGEEWWIGLYDGGTEGFFSYVECDTSTTGWAIYNWADDQPSRIPGNQEDCVYIQGQDGFYYDDRCDLSKKYICETLKVPDVIPDAYAPTNFRAENLSPTMIRLSWTPSTYDCDVTGYTIMYVGSDGEEMSVPVNGVGAVSFDISVSPSVTYTIELYANLFSFQDLGPIGPLTVTSLPEGTTNCPTGYEQGPDYTCWRFGLVPSTWYDARLSCQADDPDSDLAVIDTIEELNYVNGTRRAASYWIGFNDLGNERIFLWIDCQVPDTWQRLNWAPGSPSDLRGNQDCVQLDMQGQWDDTSCDVTRSFICKVQPKGFTEEEQYPSQFTVEATSALTAQATWLPSPYNCNLLGYYLILSDGGINDDIIVDVIGAVSVRAEITGLMPDTIYVVTIAPYTEQGVLEPMFSQSFTTLDESTICPEGYELGYDYNCYRFVMEPKNWDEARMDCMMTPNGDLAIVDTQDEMDFFVEKGFGGYDWWIGLYDRSQEGSYRWTDCSDLSAWGEAQWDIGQPSDIDGSENCGQLQDNAKFNDRACERALPYVCEIIEKDFSNAQTDPSLFFGMSSTPESVTLRWRPSDYNCDIIGYTVTYIADGLQIVEVPGGDSNSVLIRGLMAETEYTFTLRAFTYMGPRNTTRSATVTTQPPENPCEEGWFPGYEEHCYKVVRSLVTWDEARRDCMLVDGGDLVVIETAEENEYLRNETLPNDFWIGFYDVAREGEWSWVDCPADTEFANSNWAAGQPNDVNGNQDCGQVTQLGEFNDWDCNRTMMYICEVWPKGYVPPQANPSRFSGEAINPNTITLSWIPSQRYSCDVYAYQITYLDPRDVIPSLIYVMGADASTVTINDLQDGAMYNFSISSVLASGPVLAAAVAEVETPSLDDLCEPGWVPGFNYVCYKIVTTQMSWDEARADCQSIKDGDLVIMETEEEFDFIRNLVVEGDWWIGFYDKGTEGSWQWVDCNSPALWARNNWAAGQPNDLSGTQDCAQMLNAGTWNDWECDRPGQYICEVTPKDWTVIDQNPSLLRGEAASPTTIDLIWRTASTVCEVTGYRIYVIVSPENEAYSIDVEGGETDSMIIKNLMANTVYTFDIAAITTSVILPPVGTLVRIDTPASGECGNTEFLEESGFIISPNYPEPYSNNQDCLYTIMLPDESRVIEINVEALDLESGQDFLVIGSGATVDENVIATLTGSEIPQAIYTTSHQAWIRFFSDESMTASGFSLAFQSMIVEQDGEMSGSVTILLVDENAETLTYEDYDQFASSVAVQLNTFCMDSQENCQADMNGEQFESDNVMITSIVEVNEGVEVTFWVSDPNDPTGSSAGLTSEQLELFLIDYEGQIEEGNGPNFDYVIREPAVSALSEPWVIAVITLLAVCFFLLCVVLIRDCLCKSDDKTPSLDSVQMMPTVTTMVDSQNNVSPRRDSEYNKNVYFQSGESIVADETDTNQTKKAPSSPSAPKTNGNITDIATTSLSTPPTESEPVYAVSQKTASPKTVSTKTVKADVEKGVEASEDEE